MKFRRGVKQFLSIYILESIQRKMMGTLLLVMMVPLLIFMLISTYISRGTVESSEISSNLSRMELSKSYLEEQFHSYNDLLFAEIVDERLVPSITTENNISSTGAFNTQTYIKDKLFGLYNGDDDIKSVTLISYEDDRLYKVENNDFFINNYFQTQIKNTEKTAIFDVNTLNHSFSFARNIFRFEDQKLVGKIEIQVSFSLIDHIATNLQSNDEEAILLLDKEGTIVYKLNSIKLRKKISEELSSLSKKANDKNYITRDNDYYFYQNLMSGQIQLVKLVPEEVMRVGAIYIGRTGIIILLISILLTILLSILVSNQVAKPIVSLSRKMEAVGENNFNVQIETSRTDEIGHLQRKYKEMITRIKDLIEKDYKREMENRDAQFLALQSQINPHFLFNTLQVISGMALKNKAKDIYDMTQKLALMFRYITDKRGDLVRMKEEVNHLNNYLYIQKVRFGENLSIQLFVDEAVQDGLIPLLTLQPIIENSFKHGFESKLEKAKLKIDIQMVFDEIEIAIMDNGVGMTEQRLAEVREKLIFDADTQHRSIGLRNVNNRIKLYFGKEYGIEIDSKQSGFTQVIVRIPYRNGSELSEHFINRR